MIRTADVLRFVKGPVPSPKVISRAAKARNSSFHTYAKTAASTALDLNSSVFSPYPVTRRQEFNMIMSNEKEALYLSDKFGGRLKA